MPPKNGTTAESAEADARRNVVVVLAGCPHCEAAVRKLTHAAVPFTVVPAPALSPEALASISDRTVATYPKVFLGGAFLGGNDALQKLTPAGIKRLAAIK